MKATTSPLEFIEFFIIQSQFKFDEPKANININKLFKSYEIDIDFDFNQIEDDQLMVYVKAGINNTDKHKAGYVVFTEGVAIFNIKNLTELNENDKNNLIFYSSLSIAINNLRNYISNLTMNSPLGKYNLPAIDMNDMHLQKKNELDQTA